MNNFGSSAVSMLNQHFIERELLAGNGEQWEDAVLGNFASLKADFSFYTKFSKFYDWKFGIVTSEEACFLIYES